MIESQSKIIKDFTNEKYQWKKLYDFLIGLVPEYLDENIEEQRNRHKDSEISRNEWQKFTEIILSMRNKIHEKEKTIFILDKKIKDEMQKTEKSE